MPIPAIHAFFFCLVSGVGATIGVLTQSWIWAVASALVVATLAAVLGYREAINWPLIIMLALIGIATTFSLTWYASSLPYGQPQIGNFWVFGDRTLWIGRQVIAGVVTSIFGFLFIASFFVRTNDRFYFRYPVFFFIIIVIVLLLAPLFGGGFGFGPGWFFLLMGLAIGLIGVIGIVFSIVPILFKDFVKKT